MKNYMFLFLGLVGILFGSCEKIKEATEFDIETELNADIPVSTQNTVAMVLKSEKLVDDVFGFGGSTTFSLADNNDLRQYISNISNISSEAGGVVTFIGAVDGNKIMTCKLSYGVQINPDTDPAMVTAFDIPAELLANSGVIEYYSNVWTGLLIAALENNIDKVFKLELTGTSNYDIETTVKLKMPVIVSASPL